MLWWLTDLNNHTTAIIKAYGFEIRHHFRSSGNGGGVAIIYRKYLKVIKVSTRHPCSFETIAVKTKLSNNNYLFAVVSIELGHSVASLRILINFSVTCFPNLTSFFSVEIWIFILMKTQSNLETFLKSFHLMACTSM